MHSLDLLREAGFRYMMDWPLDDQPVWFRTRHGPILSIPYAHDLNDSLETVSRRTPSQIYCENLIDQFDEMLEESARRPLVMSLVLHSFILGHPHRLRRFRQVIEHIAQAARAHLAHAARAISTATLKRCPRAPCPAASSSRDTFSPRRAPAVRRPWRRP